MINQRIDPIISEMLAELIQKLESADQSAQDTMELIFKTEIHTAFVKTGDDAFHRKYLYRKLSLKLRIVIDRLEDEALKKNLYNSVISALKHEFAQFPKPKVWSKDILNYPLCCRDVFYVTLEGFQEYHRYPQPLSNFIRSFLKFLDTFLSIVETIIIMVVYVVINICTFSLCFLQTIAASIESSDCAFLQINNLDCILKSVFLGFLWILKRPFIVMIFLSGIVFVAFELVHIILTGVTLLVNTPLYVYDLASLLFWKKQPEEIEAPDKKADGYISPLKEVESISLCSGLSP